MADIIVSPEHYTSGGIETIDFIRAKLNPEQFYGYCLGNVMKYISRAELKGNKSDDLRKALIYLNWAIEEVVKNDGK